MIDDKLSQSFNRMAQTWNPTAPLELPTKPKPRYAAYAGGTTIVALVVVAGIVTMTSGSTHPTPSLTSTQSGGMPGKGVAVGRPCNTTNVRLDLDATYAADSGYLAEPTLVPLTDVACRIWAEDAEITVTGPDGTHRPAQLCAGGGVRMNRLDSPSATPPPSVTEVGCPGLGEGPRTDYGHLLATDGTVDFSLPQNNGNSGLTGAKSATYEHNQTAAQVTDEPVYSKIDVMGGSGDPSPTPGTYTIRAAVGAWVAKPFSFTVPKR